MAESEELQSTYCKLFYKAIRDMDFIPSTPCLINAGSSNQQLSSCFILDIKDSRESICEVQSKMSAIFQMNGGVGLNISALRPAGSVVETAGGMSSGPLSFMELFDLSADIWTRNNLRKGAIKIDLSDFHPDILDFIKCKDNTEVLTHMNISVALSDRFMEAVRDDFQWALEFPDYSKCKEIYNNEWDGDITKWKEKKLPTVIYKVLSARELYAEIMEHAWKTGEPGISFTDNMDRDNPNPQAGRTTLSNPCAEFVGIAGNSCNLASLNMSHMVKDGALDKAKLDATIQLAVRFLDDMITVNHLPLPEIDKVTKDWRSIGLGTMGLADMLYQLKIPYGSEECLKFIDDLYFEISTKAQAASQTLAYSRGCYPLWLGSKWDKSGCEMRNSNLISLAPNGSISFIANTSGGLEPNFALVYTRRMSDGTLFNVVNPIFEEVLRGYNLYSDKIIQKIVDNKGSCQGLTDIPKSISDVFVIASDLTPQQHLDVLITIQKHVDLSCSKTINLANSATIEDIEDIYLTAWEGKVKGVTIYRDGSRENQTLSVKSKEPPKTAPKAIHIDDVVIKFDTIQPISKNDLGTTYGSIQKYRVACGKLYINIAHNRNGDLSEIYINLGKGGICQSNINAISRLISIALRGGIRVEEIVDNLVGINCPACRVAASKGENLDGLSCPDVIGKAILKEYNGGEVTIKPAKRQKKSVASAKETPLIQALPQEGIIMNITENKNICPECGSPMLHANGCIECHNCGFSRCN